MSNRAKRKLDHIEHALSTGQTRDSGFDDIRFIHQSLPNANVKDVSLTSKIGGLEISSPIFINAMTGGGGSSTEAINRQLAEVAANCQLPMAVGSQMSAIKDENEIPSYRTVREMNEKGVIFANIGSEANVDQSKRCIEMIEANALQIHLNVIQELVMPEGDREFEGALNRIEKIVENVDVPVIVKEVGFGMSKEAALKLNDVGVQAIDVGGFGGTNFSKIENERRLLPYSFFNDWGIPTAVSIAEVREATHDVSIISSGGLQSASDIAKSIALGANGAGMAGRVLSWLQNDGIDDTIESINRLKEELTMVMTALGASSIMELQQVPIIIKGNTKEWLDERNVDTKLYANRSSME
ncbi:type 2 isopentenyl-diphosphate Delta-isomerase [Bacillus shivajii]|uniref:type 2 isopentenyl-diphosphate Delta-isomerase n=1 Tax=Bacillus shivajii TaxID=1983719 RepID=UPI001CFBC56C|nr:type 2 isopentenyl-diphosphate Delta-isomerase [Bacillus shivajii]UCZ54755.1 type 2 isopentenyl-diphosphate Delta-isomerase [Bacillus shivajii]